MKQTKNLPFGKSFVAIWDVEYKGETTLFSCSLHYDKDSAQYLYYDGATDTFLPECDHGFTRNFFKHVEATFFIVEEC